ncbi:ROK family transcriptional regulator [Sinorhizobium meliloti]|uniref:ROK family transcriptional regulator n=1 Tax=Rhizobium meliloti TaxID=382 RepID=UPI001F1B0B40|nr:ROK family transcriptional regulator [Sinorhizobium meliloti]
MSIPTLSLNERRLIEMISMQGEIARVDLTQRSGMTGASVTRLTAGLIEMGLLSEEPERTGAQGQPRRLLRLRADRFIAAGVTFSLSRMEVAVVNLAGSVLASRSLSVDATTASGVATGAQGAVQSMVADLSMDQSRLVGIGCSVPGNFGTVSHLLKAHPFFPAFEDSGAVEAFRDSFDIPCYVENDGAAAALGEYVFGRGGEADDPLLFIHIGHGVGGGVIIDGRLYRGAHGNACLPGVLYPYDLPRPSGQDLLVCLSRAGFPVTDFDGIPGLPHDARPELDAWVKRAAAQLRQAVRVATGFFDPALIVIGGRLPLDLNERLAAAILVEPMEGPSRGLLVAPVVASRLGAQAGAIGAACIPLFATFFSGAVSDGGSTHINGRRR